MPTEISMKDVSVKGTTVTVSGSGGSALVNSLVQKNGITLAELSHTFGFIHPNEISIANDGSVKINNPQLAKHIQARAGGDDGGHFFDTNCSCKGG